MTMGDNLYIANESNASQADVDLMMSVFDRPNLKDLLIYAIRGNHDCAIPDPYFEVNITNRYPTWRMPDLYYSRTYDIGNGKKYGALYVDTCLAICSNFSYAGDSGGHLLMSEEMENLKFGLLNCSDPFTIQRGNEMYKWINETLDTWAKDESIVWTSSIQHHPLFSKWWPDYINITSNFLPMLIDYKVDFYLNGHEHDMTYAFYPYSQIPSLIEELK
jgi:tartrate-resistant acid phosphatase type 5